MASTNEQEELMNYIYGTIRFWATDFSVELLRIGLAAGMRVEMISAARRIFSIGLNVMILHGKDDGDGILFVDNQNFRQR